MREVDLNEREKESVRYALTEYIWFLKGRRRRETPNNQGFYNENINHLERTVEKFKPSQRP